MFPRHTPIGSRFSHSLLYSFLLRGETSTATLVPVKTAIDYPTPPLNVSVPCVKMYNLCAPTLLPHPTAVVFQFSSAVFHPTHFRWLSSTVLWFACRPFLSLAGPSCPFVRRKFVCVPCLLSCVWNDRHSDYGGHHTLLPLRLCFPRGHIMASLSQALLSCLNPSTALNGSPYYPSRSDSFHSSIVLKPLLLFCTALEIRRGSTDEDSIAHEKVLALVTLATPKIQYCLILYFHFSIPP